MKLLNIFLSLLCFQTVAVAQTSYSLEFTSESPLKFEYTLYELPPMFESKVGSVGTIDSPAQLEAVRQIPNLSFQLQNSKRKIILALVVKNLVDEDADFFVSPHGTTPAAASLDFHFDCLCYHHVYHLKKGKLWFRVMKILDTSTNGPLRKIVIKHKVVPWKSESAK